MLKLPAINGHRLRRSFKPDFIAESVLEIDFAYLADLGIKACLIDLDGTVVARGTYEVDPAFTKLLKKQNLKVYIATNRPRSRSLQNLKEQLHADGVIHPVGIWGKPFARYYAQAASEHNLNPNELVMIGDRYLQDIYGANTAGLRTVLVYKLDKPTNAFDKLISGIERWRTNKLAKRYAPIKQN